MVYAFLLFGAKKAASWGAADLSIVQVYMLVATTNIEKKTALFDNNINRLAYPVPPRGDP